MDCCCEGIDVQFDHDKAISKLKKYRDKGPQKTTQILVNALIDQEIQGMSLLDVGGGIGAIQHELLKAGVEHAVNLEASKAYIEACKDESNRQGTIDKITHVHGDFAQLLDAPAADIVTLERVICCYPDYQSLVSQSCSKTKKFLALVYPRENWLVKLGMEIYYNLKFKFSKKSFRVYMHPTREVESIIIRNGFRKLFFQTAGVWQIFVYGIES